MAGLLKIGSAHLRTESSESSGISISARNLFLEARRQMSCSRGIIRATQSSSFFVLVQGRGDELYAYLLLQLDCIASFDKLRVETKSFLIQAHSMRMPPPPEVLASFALWARVRWISKPCMISAAWYRWPALARGAGPDVAGPMELATVSWVCRACK